MIPYCILVIEDDDDREFMASLYQRYNRLMYNTIIKIVKSPYDTEDVLQIALVKLIDKVELLRSRSRDQLVNYILSTSKTTALDFVNRSRPKNEVSLEEYGELPDPNTDPDYSEREVELRMIKGEELEVLRQILPRLDARSRRLLEGYYFLDIPMAELGHELGIKPDSVRMALARARRKTFELLQNDTQERNTGSP